MSATIHNLHAQAEPLPQAANDLPDAANPRDRYIEAVIRLCNEAIEQHELEPCVDALAYSLAWVVFSLDRMDVTGDVLTKFGRHIEALEAGRRAKQELQALRDGGGETN